MNEDVDYDPWDDAPDEIDPEEIREMLYESGIKSFPLDVLEKMWLKELRDVGLSKVEAPTGIPPKAESQQVDRMSPPLQGDVRQVRLGASRKGAWIAFDGPRTKRGYMDIVVLAEPLRTETAIVAALTILEASPVNDVDFEQLQEALVQHVQAHPELESVKLQELLSQLPIDWFRHQMTQIDERRRQQLEELEALPSSEQKKVRKKLQLTRWEQRQRDAAAWQRSLTYQVALLRHRRPDFDDLDLEEQLRLVGKFCSLVNNSLKAQRDLAAFLEYGTSQQGLPKSVVEQARAQVRAAVLADVEGLSHYDIAVELGEPIPERYRIDMKIPAVQRLVREGRDILDKALGEGEWSNRAQEMKSDAEHYLKLNKMGRMIEDLARWHSWSPEVARARREDPTGFESIIRFLHIAAGPRFPYPGPYHL
jgi:hypothetical protein